MKRINSALLYNLFIKFCKSGDANWAEVRKRGFAQMFTQVCVCREDCDFNC